MPATTSPLRTLFRNIRPRRVRSFLEFAEEEIILPEGPRKGMRFSSGFMLWTRLVLEMFSSGLYRRFFGSGPVQSGKTLIFFAIPILYHLFEVGENVILGAPVIDMAQGIYEQRLLPILLRTRYAALLPTKGAGSKGGKFTAITFQNGAVLRFMGAGGGDEQRSSFTARVVVLTEIDKMDVPGESSQEADPITQLEARASAYGDQAVIYGECTMSDEEGRVHQEVVEFGTDTRVYIPCSHCGEFVVPERDQFGGWQGAANVIEAREGACYACPKCGAEWSEADRAHALQSPVLASKGQEITKKGKVTGDPPRTNTWGFRWNAMHNSLTTMADIGEREWRAERSDRPADMKGILQFVWALPWKDDLLNLSGITRDIVLHKITKHPKGVAPDPTEKLVVFIDLGLYQCWWAAVAFWGQAEGHVADYGAIEVPQGRDTNPLAILSSLRAFREDVLKHGWLRNGKPVVHDLCLVDMGYQKEVAYTFVKESGQGRYFATKGCGSGRGQDSWRAPKKAKGRLLGNEWVIVDQPEGIRLVELHADHWKREVHQGFAVPAGAPGSLTLFHAEPHEHGSFARQITAEREEEIYKPGVGTVTVWNRIQKANHYLDVVYGCRAGADMLGVKLMPPPAAKQKGKQRTPAAKPKKRIRTKY